MHRCLLVTTVIIIQLAPSFTSYEHNRQRFQHPFALPDRSSPQRADNPAADYPKSRHKLLNLLRQLPPIVNAAALIPEIGLRRHSDHQKFSKTVQESDDGRLQLDFQKFPNKKKSATGLDNDEDEDDDYDDDQRRFGNSDRRTTSPPDGSEQRFQTGYSFKRSEGPSLSIVNPLDVLRQRLMLEMARRRMKESQVQIAANKEYLDNLGKRSVDSQMVPFTSRSYHRPNHQRQQLQVDQDRRETRSV